MPALVVRELADWLAARGGVVVAGATPPGLDRSVSGVARPRRIIARELDVINVHDVVVVSIDSFSPITDVSLEDIIAVLAETQAALLVAGMPHRSAAPAQGPYDLADRLALPLLAMPANTDLVDLARRVAELVQQREVAAARFVRAALTAIGQASQAEQPIVALGQALADHTGLYFILEDDRRKLVHTAVPADPPCAEDQVSQALSSHAARQMVRSATPSPLGDDIPIQRHLPGKLARAIVPLRAGAGAIAYLSLLGPESSVSPLHVEVLARVAPEFAFEMGKLRQVSTDWRRSTAEDLTDVLHGPQSEIELVRRAAAHGADLSLPHLVIVALPPAQRASEIEWAMNRLERVTATLPHPWATAHEGCLELLLGARETIDDVIARLASTVLADGGGALGIGRPGRGLAGVRRSLVEAEQAARIQVQQSGVGVRRYADLGVMQLLYPLQSSGKLEEFCRETLDPLLRADLHQGDALLTTLEAWFAANGNLTEASRRLSLHRNTLMYRLRRIEEALGTSLEDAELRLTLQLALKIWRMTQR